MRRDVFSFDRRWGVGVAIGLGLVGSAAAGPFVDSVLTYDPGSNAAVGYTDPAAVIGAPARFTGVQFGFPSVVSPFSPPFDSDQIISVGFGGSITVHLGQTIRDDAAHAFGIDFIVFGNAGFIDMDYPNGSVGPAPAFFGSQAPVIVEASQDGQTWAQVAVQTLDLWPTLGYRDSGPFDIVPGLVKTSFFTPMDPMLTLADIAGMSYTELVGAYGRSGGGIGFDLSSAGLTEAQYLRFTHAGSETQRFQIDAITVVPAPGVIGVLAFAGLMPTRRTRIARA